MKKPFLETGKITGTHGVRGEMKILPWSDGPDFLLDYKRVRIAEQDYRVESCRIQKTCNLLKLHGIDTMEAAQAMHGKTLEIYREDADPDLIFAVELIGMEVYQDEALIGKLTEVLDYPGNKVYVVKGEKEYMIPAVKAFVQSIDMDGNRMQVKLIEGMASNEN